MKGDVEMSEHEKELINIIRENDNSERAVATAIQVILSYLEQHGSSEGRAAADLQGLF